MAKPSFLQLTAFFDANPAKYKNEPEPDGYNATRKLLRTLRFRPLVANEESQGLVPKPIDADDVINTLSDPQIQAIPGEVLTFFVEACENRNRARIQRIGRIMLKKGWIDTTARDAIIAELDSQIPDPDYKSQVRGESDYDINFAGFDRIGAPYLNTLFGRT